MSIFTEHCYKTILKTRVKTASLAKGRITLKKIAARIPVQYTYLSRALNHEGTHLSEDHLHEFCKLLHFFPDETEYVLTLRGLATAASQSRKDFLTKKLVSLRSSQEINARPEKSSAVSGEMNFVLSPLAWITYFALDIPQFRENPRKLASSLGLDVSQLRAILQSMHDLNLIEIGENIFQVTKVNKNHFHYHTDHPLTHLHQQMLRLLCDSHYLRLPLEKRHRFMATFNADDESFEKIEKLFGAFIKEVEKVAVASPSKRTFQMNFELFPWFL